VKPISADELFRLAGVLPSAPIKWGDNVPCKRAGVYVIEIDDISTVRFMNLSPEQEYARLRLERDRLRWRSDQNIIYIGRTGPTVGLQERLRLFRGHDYGKGSPHSGGQAILLLNCAKTIHWAAVDDYKDAEIKLAVAFWQIAKRLPFGNIKFPGGKKARALVSASVR
jgi:hypothetical protein